MLEGLSLLVFADDWGLHPSSAQHLFRRFLAGNRVVWVNTIGLRLPRPSWYDFRKVLGKLRTWSRPRHDHPPDAGPRPEVHDVPLVPLPLGRVARALNARLLRGRVEAWVEAGQLDEAFILVTTLPLTADLVGRFPRATFVYYLVDDYASWPGLGGPLVRAMDEQQVCGADLVVAAARSLADHYQGQAADRVRYLPHGVDVAHFLGARHRRDQLRATGQGPLADVVFFGAVDERIDLILLAAVAASRPALRFFVVGPSSRGHHPVSLPKNVQTRGAVPYPELPELLAGCTVAFLPYVQGPFGERLSPLKAREALAAGLEVVATDVPELRALGRGVSLGRSAGELAGLLDRALSRPADVPSPQELAADSWEARAEELSGWLAAARARRLAS